MSEEENWRKKLKKLGYKKMRLERDAPFANYVSHSHEKDISIVVLEGDMVLNIDGEEIELIRGEKAKIKPDEKHTAKIGANGCTYIVAEK